MMEKSVSEALEQKGWMAWMYLIPERMVVSYHFTELVLEITEIWMLVKGSGQLNSSIFCATKRLPLNDL